MSVVTLRDHFSLIVSCITAQTKLQFEGSNSTNKLNKKTCFVVSTAFASFMNKNRMSLSFCLVRLSTAVMTSSALL